MNRKWPIPVLLLGALIAVWAARAASSSAPPVPYAWWWETSNDHSTLWRGSPISLSTATRVWESEAPLLEAALSPDGRWLALVTDDPHPRLWLGHTTTADFQVADVAAGLGGLTWLPDGRLAYGMGAPRQGESLTGWETSLWVLQPDSGERRPLSVLSEQQALLLGQDATGQPVLLFADGTVQRGPQRSSLSTIPRQIQPDAAHNAWLWSDGNTLHWGSLNGPQTSLLLPPWKQRCGFAWYRPPDQVLVCQVDAAQPRITLWVHDQQGRQQPIGPFDLPAGEFPPAPLALAPDGRWLAMNRYPAGFLWLNLETGDWLLPAERPLGYLKFIGWEPTP